MTMPAELLIRDLHVKAGGKDVLAGVTLHVKPGEVHAVMGPNGSGKSTLCLALAGHPRAEVTAGVILVNNDSLLTLTPEQRARKGIFLAFQNPAEVQGVELQHFLYAACRARHGRLTLPEFMKRLHDALETLSLPKDFASRQLNAGMSGGEKKRCEALQLLLLKPELAILDEIDSGLDVDSLRTVAKAINALRGPHFTCLLITHYSRMLDEVKPDAVHVLSNGRIGASGGPELVQRIEATGYATVTGTPTKLKVVG
jgi:Fe-S cluster assembly ATP-binding protein